jgi:hypothetical protein
VEHLSSSVSEAINTYLTPITTFYDSETFQREIEYRIIFDKNNGLFKGDYAYLNAQVEDQRTANLHQVFAFNNINLINSDIWTSLYGDILATLNQAVLISKQVIEVKEGEAFPNLKLIDYLIAKDSITGTDLLDQVTITGLPSDTASAKVGAYTITYTLVDNGRTITTQSIIKVSPTEVPTDTDYSDPTINTSNLVLPLEYSISGAKSVETFLEEIYGLVTAKDERYRESTLITYDLTGVIHFDASLIVWDIPGSYNIYVTVSDFAGRQTSTIIQITVAE